MWFSLALIACGPAPFDGEIGEFPDPWPERDTVDTVDTAEPVRETPWDCYARVRVDFQDDGDPEYWGYEVYDPVLQDQLLREEHDVWDDGRLEWVTDWTWDDGLEVFEAVDDDGDGVYDETTAWSYDDDGQLLEEAFDDDGDGAPDEIWTWLYDPEGRVEEEAVDLDGDGAVDERRTYLYDLDGRLILVVEDLIAEATGMAYDYTYDAYDRLIRVEGFGEGTDNLIEVTEYSYPGPFDSYLRRRDVDNDGAWDEITDVVLDERGYLVAETLDLDGDGHAEAGWSDVVWDDERRFLSGRFFIDPDPTGSVDPDVWDYDYTFVNPTGPWYQLRRVEHRSAFDGPVGSTYVADYEWRCP